MKMPPYRCVLVPLPAGVHGTAMADRARLVLHQLQSHAHEVDEEGRGRAVALVRECCSAEPVAVQHLLLVLVEGLAALDFL